MPGSGSAVVFQGMLACKLLATVISLTIDEKRNNKYSHVLPEILRSQEEISIFFQIFISYFMKTLFSLKRSLNLEIFEINLKLKAWIKI
ncbi:hypothetical protein [Lunatibacter salilacus]|uniref:hypothetical protein n=1 Tax=Lunatibacter salilacus TaxID=2483804 RepID=UPI003743DEFA